jgi:hypothetical protein
MLCNCKNGVTSTAISSLQDMRGILAGVQELKTETRDQRGLAEAACVAVALRTDTFFLLAAAL